MRVCLAILIGVATCCPAFAQQADQRKGADRKKPAPFRWINALPKNLPSTVRHETFHSESNGAEVGYAIYLPPGYESEENRNRRYPVVYALHGGRPGSEAKAVRLAVPIDRHIRSGEVPAMIYVFPNGGRLSHYDHGRFKGEQAFLELIDHVDQNYRTVADRTGRAVEGFSQGGRGTGRYMFKHADLFCSAAPMGGGHQHEKRISESDGVESASVTIEPATNNTWDLARRFAQSDHPDLQILIVVGDEDFNHEANVDWHQHLTSLGIESRLMVLPGVKHSAMAVYEKIGPTIMNFHAGRFREHGHIDE
ncbi:Endo-1,4-beta-xylanase/feruloyl esterase precursor [Maioricimonas rarisocia]|uniref:Endo-1,4-beta-xylanase/feruloyl esterase n=1 Tax=Maioricimonas rarisocia TaxID=2528026 RepID=A0A517ZD17_9PLAN|nr:alpha/beta hydrolase-fold protein [Maioricimonas rarisocia]QDU40355.1 Endo-1,4-beta-xylanase/feruloyl esterase precursor [Maioricimonas rarisocia]